MVSARRVAEEVATIMISEIKEGCLVSSDKPGIRWEEDYCCILFSLEGLLEEITDSKWLIDYTGGLFGIVDIDDLSDEELEQIYRHFRSIIERELRNYIRYERQCEEIYGEEEWEEEW